MLREQTTDLAERFLSTHLDSMSGTSSRYFFGRFGGKSEPDNKSAYGGCDLFTRQRVPIRHNHHFGRAFHGLPDVTVL